MKPCDRIYVSQMGHIGVSMTKEQIIELLSRSEVFCRAENKTINRIAEESTVVFSRGQIVSDCKEYFGKIGVILSGTIVAEEKKQLRQSCSQHS